MLKTTLLPVISNGFLVKLPRLQDHYHNYVIELSDGNTVRRHVDHIKARENDQDDVQNPERDDTNWDYVDTDSSQSTELSTDNNTTESTLRRSSRICKTPQQFDQST